MSVQTQPYGKMQITQFLVGFFVAAILCIITISLNTALPPLPLSSQPNLWLVVYGLVIVMPVLLWMDTKLRRIRVLFFVVLHIIASMAMLFYVGTYDPMVSLWLILCIVTYAEFGAIAFRLASALLLITTIFFCTFLVFAESDFRVGEYTFYSLSYCIVLIVTGYVVTRILESVNQRSREVDKLRKVEAQQLNKVNVLLNSISDAILTLDSEGRITSQNAAALSLFDTNQSLVGHKLAGVLTPSDEKGDIIDVNAMIEHVTKNISRDDLMIKNNEQGSMRLSLQMSPIYSENQREGIVMVIRDITKQKTLEDEKDEFISVASHELRTPIAVAEASLSNLMLMQEKGINPEMLKSAASTAHDEIIYLAGVVNDLSTLSRAERGVADKPEPVDMDQLLHGLYKRYELDAAKKKLKFNLDIKGKLPIVEASRLYVEEMLQNFITNALKYTKEGSVTLAGEVVAGGVKCSVIDTGIGISKSDQKRLGERFFRSEDYRTRETNGTGLGLYVVKKLAHKIGTTIDVESRLNQGSAFSITVPLKSSAQVTGKRSSIDG